MSMGFDKETFKKSVLFNMKNVFRKTVDEATKEQMYQAVAYAVKDVIIDEWIATHKEYEKQDVKNPVLPVHGVFNGSCSWQQHHKFHGTAGCKGSVRGTWV